MAQSFFPLSTPVSLTPTTGSWQTVDLSSYIPDGATGTILKFLNNSSSFGYNIGARRPGSGIGSYPLGASYYTWTIVGVNSNRQVELYRGNSLIDIYLIGYTKSGVTFLTSDVEVSPSTLNSWQTVDLSTYCPSGTIGAIFYIAALGADGAIGFRKKGSTDNRTQTAYGIEVMGFVVGCDTSRQVDIYRSNTGQHMYLLGYITGGATFNTNASDISLSSTGAWYDLSSLPSESGMAFIEVVSSAGYNFGLRPNGSNENIVKKIGNHCFAIVPCDANGIIEGYIENLGVDFFLIGYTEYTPPSLNLGAMLLMFLG